MATHLLLVSLLPFSNNQSTSNSMFLELDLVKFFHLNHSLNHRYTIHNKTSYHSTNQNLQHDHYHKKTKALLDLRSGLINQQLQSLTYIQIFYLLLFAEFYLILRSHHFKFSSNLLNSFTKRSPNFLDLLISKVWLHWQQAPNKHLWSLSFWFLKSIKNQVFKQRLWEE